MEFVNRDPDVAGKCGRTTILKEDSTWLVLFAGHNQLPKGQGDVLFPCQSVPSLCHWKVLSLLVYQTGSPEQILGMERRCRLLESRPLQYVDSHFHLDMLRRRTGVSGIPSEGCGDAELLHGIANYCFPRNWPSSSQRQNIRQDPRTFGIHPKVAGFEPRWRLEEFCKKLEALLGVRGLVAIGECGIDIAENQTPATMELQKYLLERQVVMAAKSTLPL